MNLKTSTFNFTLQDISQANYFNDACTLLFFHQLITQEQLKQIEQECLAVLREIATTYSFGDTSVTIDVATDLLQSIEYTIGARLRMEKNIQSLRLTLLESPIKQLYMEGIVIIQQQVQDAKLLTQLAIKTSIQTTNLAYHQTLHEALPAFFQTYDYEFSAHTHGLTLDYPLYLFDTKFIGVEAIKKYAMYAYYENLFLKTFQSTALNQLFEQNIPLFEEQIISLFQLSFTHYLLCKLIHQTNLNVGISIDEWHLIQMHLSIIDNVSELQETFAELIEIDVFYQSLPKKVQVYLRNCLPNISEEIFSQFTDNFLPQQLLITR